MDNAKLVSGSRVAVIGGGPAGSLFSYFLLDMARRIESDITVDIFEPRRFTDTGPAGCNMCGGIISESLVQLLAAEGIELPATVVQRGINSYVMHTDLGRVRIDPPGNEHRIAAVHRGSGPKGSVPGRWQSFDGYLLELAGRKGARHIPERVTDISFEGGKPLIKTRKGSTDCYDLVAVASGINTPFLKNLGDSVPGFVPPQTTKTYIAEFPLGQDVVDLCLGDSMHVFLLDLPRLEFAAIIPKGEYATVCLLGSDIDKELIDAFFSTPQVRHCFPPGWSLPAEHCQCGPGINVRGAPLPLADRLVFIGDSGVNRLYKDGIGGAYRTAKAAARTAVFNGVSAADLRTGFLPTCRAMAFDNALGRIIFTVTTVIRKVRVARRAVLGMIVNEQNNPTIDQRMGGVLWDTFTGSAPYRDVFLRTLHPAFLVRMLYESLAGVLPRLGEETQKRRISMRMGELGKAYQQGEEIFREGDSGDKMYVVQTGKVQVVKRSQEGELVLATLGPGDIFGEMALFGNNVRSATVRILEEARILSIDKKIFVQKIHDDPSLAFRVIQKMSDRIRNLNEEVTKLTHRA